MAITGKILSAPLKALGLLKTPGKAPDPLPAVTRDDARDQATQADELRRRRGGAADLLTGPGGAEPTGATGKTTLG
jgi:hypothetical protein